MSLVPLLLPQDGECSDLIPTAVIKQGLKTAWGKKGLSRLTGYRPSLREPKACAAARAEAVLQSLAEGLGLHRDMLMGIER